MKTLGIIGGIGPESTIEYYRLIIEAYRRRKPDNSYPSFILNNINLSRLVQLITANELSEVTDWLSEEIVKLARAGADFGLLAANTPHIVFDDLQKRSPIPLLSIVEATCENARNLGFKTVGLFGTRFTMQGEFYRNVFSRSGIEIFIPEGEDLDYVHNKYMNELINGIVLPETREGLLRIVNRLKEMREIEALILGGTELSLILKPDASEFPVPFLDTTSIHAENAVGRMLS